MFDTRPVPGALIGYTKHGKPIYLAAGGSQPEGEPPAPGAQANNSASPAQPPVDSAPTSAPGPKHAAPTTPPWEREGQTFDAQRAWNLIESLREEKEQIKAERARIDAESKEHKTGRTTAEQQAAEAKDRLKAILKAAGLNPDGTELPEDPEQLAARLAERAEAAEARVWTIGVKSAVYDQASAAGVNAKLVYNSNDFRDLLDDLVEQDPDTPAFRAVILQKMKDFVAANPEYATASAAEPPKPTNPKPDPSQGSRGETPTRSQGLAAAVSKAMASPR
jgi:hypothetical protein